MAPRAPSARGVSIINFYFYIFLLWGCFCTARSRNSSPAGSGFPAQRPELPIRVPMCVCQSAMLFPAQLNVPGALLKARERPDARHILNLLLRFCSARH
jgi:hypothetical protein